MKTCALIAVVFTVVLVSGCSIFSADDEIKPTKLELIDQQLEPTLIWTAKAASSNNNYWANLQMAVSDESLFIADHSGSVVALDIEDGRKHWSVELDLPISGGVAYGAQKLVLGTIEGQVYALSARDGSVIWSSIVSSEVISSPSVSEDIVVAQSIDNRLCFWRTAKNYGNMMLALTSVRGNSSSIILNNRVIAAFDNGKLVHSMLKMVLYCGKPIGTSKRAY